MFAKLLKASSFDFRGARKRNRNRRIRLYLTTFFVILFVYLGMYLGNEWASKAALWTSRKTTLWVKHGEESEIRSKDNFLIVLFRYFILFAQLRCVSPFRFVLLIFGRMLCCLCLFIYSIRLLWQSQLSSSLINAKPPDPTWSDFIYLFVYFHY